MKKFAKILHTDKKQNKNPNQPPNLLGHQSSNATPQTSIDDDGGNQPLSTAQALMYAQGPLIAPALPTAAHALATSLTTTAQPSSTDGIVNTICDGFTEALKIAKEATTGIPIAEPVLRGVVAAVELGNKVKSNWSEMENLLKRIEKVQPVLQTLENRLRDCRFEDKESYLYRGIVGCIETLKEGGDRIRDMQTHGWLTRIAQGTTDAERLLSAYKNIEQAIGDLRLALQLAIERDTSTIRKNQALQSLPVASTAAHTSGLHQSNVARRECTKGTRTKVLEDIRSWLRSDNAAPVFWLTGAAGMGKTTIAMTICKEIENHFNSPVDSPVIDGFDRCPLVSFFASRQLDSGDAKHFLPSICRRLADHSSSYGTKLADALERDSTLATAEHDKQFEDVG